MDFTQGERVKTADGEDLGTIERVILNPRTRDVTGVVIRKGLLLKKDKVIPISMIQDTEGDEVHLRPFPSKIDLDSLPDYEETHYVMNSERDLRRTVNQSNQAQSLFWYPPAPPPGGLNYPGFDNSNYVAGAGVGEPFAKEIEYNIPEGDIAIKEGAKVTTLDGKTAGTVTKILTGPQSDHVSHFVISHGALHQDHLMVPIHWVDHVSDDEVMLAVSSEILDELPKYHQEM